MLAALGKPAWIGWLQGILDVRRFDDESTQALLIVTPSDMDDHLAAVPLASRTARA
jgi:hypothetical protein